jgi:Cellulose binding domain
MRVSRGDHHERRRAPSGPALRELLPWLPTLLGVCALIALLIIAATRFTSPSEVRALPPAPPFLPAPVQSPTPSSTPISAPPSTRPGPRVRPATATTSPRPARSSTRATTAPAPAPGPVSGRYRVVDSYDNAFIGEVLVTNSSGRDSDWRVELRFPPAVGDLITSWVESAPQATLRRSGDSFIWSSGVPVPARGQVALRFHFSRSGSGDLPSACTVNGQSCTGLG